MQNLSPWLEELDPKFSPPKLSPDHAKLVQLFSSHNPIFDKNADPLLWKLLKQILLQSKLKIPCHQFTDYSGYSNNSQINQVLEANYQLRLGKKTFSKVILSSDSFFSKTILPKYIGLYKLVDQKTLNKLLKTTGFFFVAAQKHTYASINISLFCQKLSQTNALPFQSSNALKIQRSKVLTFHRSKVLYFAKASPAHRLNPVCKTYYFQNKKIQVLRLNIGKKSYLILPSPLPATLKFLSTHTSFSPNLYKGRFTHTWTTIESANL